MKTDLTKCGDKECEKVRGEGITTYSRGLLNVSSIAFREDTFFCSVWKAERGKFDWEGNKFGGQLHFYYRTINRPQIKKILFRKPQECSDVQVLEINRFESRLRFFEDQTKTILYLWDCTWLLWETLYYISFDYFG